MLDKLLIVLILYSMNYSDEWPIVENSF